MRYYENLAKLSENRLPQRSYYIPKGGYTNLNGEWKFKFYECDFEENYVEVYVSYLRKKIAKVSKKIKIKTIRGLGYKLTNV